MTRKELQAIKKPKTGLMTYRGPKQPDGYCEVALIMKTRWGSIKTIRELHNAFRVYLGPVRPV